MSDPDTDYPNEALHDPLREMSPKERAALNTAHADTASVHRLNGARVTPSPVVDDGSNPKTRFGLAKPPLGLIPPVAMIEEAMSFRLGAIKYGPANWREKAVSASTYYHACIRHLVSWWDGEEIDPESGASHLGHARACLGILLDAQACGMLVDDRPKPGVAASRIKHHTQPLSE